LQLGVLKFKVHHDAFMNTKSQFDLIVYGNYIMLDKTEEDKYMSWKFCKVFEYRKEKGDGKRTNHKYLVEWNNINNSKYG
jgi:hypothetical protein